MAVFRVEKNHNYTVMSNNHLRNISPFLKAKGLLSLMLSLPDNWDYTTRGLAKICKDGVDSIGSTIKELEVNGYLVRNRIRNDKGQLTEIEYTILEHPQSVPPDAEKPELENPVLENPILDKPEQALPKQENPAQLSTYVSSTKKLITESSNPILSSTKEESDGNGTDEMDKRNRYRELILKNIEYKYLIQNPRLDIRLLDELVELMVDTVCTNRKMIRIAGG